MSTLTFSIDIRAPKQKVWEAMLSDATYRQWTAAFHEGSYFEGSWDKGSDIRFLAEDDGKLGGMRAKIVENTPYEYVSIEHVGEIVDGKAVPSAWAGSRESYRFSEKDGVTTVAIELKSSQEDPEMAKMFEQMWPKALGKLKTIVEQ